MNKDNFIVFGSPQIFPEDIEEVVDSLKSGWLGTGPKVAHFEKNFNVPYYNESKHLKSLFKS